QLLSQYRSQLGASRRLCRGESGHSRALCRGRSRFGDEFCRHGPADRQSVEFCASAAPHGHPARLRSLDPAGARGRGQCGDDRLSAGSVDARNREERSMRWIRYEANGQPVYGILEGDTVVEVTGDPFAGYERTSTRRPLSSVKLLVPVEPRTFYAAGLNYPEHVTEAAKKLGREPELPPYADIGYRA